MNVQAARQQARLTVCARATDVDDAAALLAMLGLMDDDPEFTYDLLPGQNRAVGVHRPSYPNQVRRPGN